MTSNEKRMPEFRCKARFADGRMQHFTDHRGEQEDERRELFVVWRNENGYLSVQFAPDVAKAIAKVIGQKDSDKVFFDLYENRGKPKSKPAPEPDEDEDDADDDLNF